MRSGVTGSTRLRIVRRSRSQRPISDKATTRLQRSPARRSQSRLGFRAWCALLERTSSKPSPPLPHLPRRSTSNNQSHLTLYEFSRHRRQSIVLIVGPASFDRHVAALYIAAVTQALVKRTKLPRPPAGRRATKQPNHRQVA